MAVELNVFAEPNDPKEPTNTDDSASWGDVFKAIGSGAVGLAKEAVAAAQAVAIKNGGNPYYFEGVRQDLGSVQKGIEDSITPGGKAARDAQFIPDDQHQSVFRSPISSGLMKGASMLPVLGVAAILPEAALVQAGAFAVQGMGSYADAVMSATDSMSDADLAKASPIFAEMLQNGMSSNEARMQFRNLQISNAGLLRSAAVGGVAGVGIGRVMHGASPGALKGAGMGAAEMAGVMGAQGGQLNYDEQQARVSGGMQSGVEWADVLRAAGNAGLEGGVIGGAIGGVRGALSGRGEKPKPVEQSEKGGGTGNAPPPSETADIGNNVNPPTRDQNPVSGKDAATGAPPAVGPKGQAVKAKAKKGKKGPQIETVSELGASSTEAAAIPGSEANAEPATPSVPSKPAAPATGETVDPTIAAALPSAPEPVAPAKPPASAPVAGQAAPTTVEAAPAPAAAKNVKPVDETHATLLAQRQDLQSGARPAVMYASRPTKYPKIEGFNRLQVRNPNTKKYVWFDYDPNRATAEQIQKAVKSGDENQILGLGDKNKEQVLSEASPANPPAAVQVKNEEGTPVKDIATTQNDAQRQATLQQETAPAGHSVEVTSPDEVIKGREAGKLFEDKQPEPPPVRKIELTEEQKQAALDSLAKHEARKNPPRVLEDVSPEGVKAREAADAEMNKRLDENLGKVKEEPAEEATPTGKKWTQAEKDTRARDNQLADALIKDPEFAPRPGEAEYYDGRRSGAKPARLLMVARARAMVDAAEKMGIKIPEQIKDATDKSMHYGDGLTLLAEAKALAFRKDNKAEHYQRFYGRENDIRSGKKAEALAERRAEGEAANRKDQGDVDTTPGTDTAKPHEAEERVTESVDAKREGEATSHNENFEEDLKNANDRNAREASRRKLEQERRRKALVEKGVPEEIADKIAKVEALARDQSTTEAERAAAAKKAEELREAHTGKLTPGEKAELEEMNAPAVRAAQDKAGTFKEEKRPKFEGARPKVEGKISLKKKEKETLPHDSADAFKPGETVDGKKEGALADSAASKSTSGSWAETAAEKAGLTKDKVVWSKGDLALVRHVNKLGGAIILPAKEGFGILNRTLPEDGHKWFSSREHEELRQAEADFHKEWAAGIKPDEFHNASLLEKAKALNTQTMREALKNLDLKDAGPLTNFIRGKLIDAIGDVKIHELSADDMARLAGGDRGTMGLWTWGKQVGENIAVLEGLSAAQRNHVIVHEGIHGLVQLSMMRKPEFQNQMRAIMNAVDKADPLLRSTKRGQYAWTNVHEFVAEAWSNKDLQQSLREVTLPPEVARQLGMEQWRKASLWNAFVDSVRRLIGMPRDTVKAMEAIIKVTEEASHNKLIDEGVTYQLNKEFGLNAASSEFKASDVAKKARDILDRPDLAAKGRAVRHMTDTLTMLSQRAARYGDKFGEAARNVSELAQRMDVFRSKQLERAGGGLEISREGAELERSIGPEKFREAVDIAFAATEHNVDLTPGATNEHLGKDATKGWQAKAKLPELQRRFSQLPKEARDWLQKAAQFGRDERNAQSFEQIKRVLDAAGINDPALAKRIFNDGVTDADKQNFKTDKIVEHLDALSDLKKMDGWYFPLSRQGDFVVNGRVEVKAPEASHVTRIGNNEVQFADPKGGGSKTGARNAAREFVEKHDLNHVGTREVWVDKNDHTKILPSDDINAIPAYRVRMMDQHTSFHRTEKEANAAAEEMRGNKLLDVRVDKKAENPNASWGGIMPSQYETMIGALKKRDKFKNMSAAEQNEVIRAMREANVRLLPGTRIQQHSLQRRNVQGYSRDLLHSVAQYARQSAGFLAKVEYQPKIDAALKQMSDEVKSNNDTNNVRRGELYREMESRVYRGNDVPPETTIAKVMHRLNQVSMLDKLAGPSFHIINSMEPWTTAAPIIAGRQGVGAAISTLKSAYNMIGARSGIVAGLKDTARAFKKDEGFTDYRALFKKNIDASVGGERAKRLNELLDHLHDTNLFGHEAGMEMKRIADPASSAPGRALDRAELVARQVGQTIEAINRAVVGISAYDLEYKRNNGSHEAALRYAHDVVHDTMGNYSASNASPMFNTTFGRSALQFKKFAQKTYYLLGKTMGAAIRGDKEAMKQFAGVMFTHGVLAGALGLPLEPVKAALMAADFTGLTGFTYDDFEQAVRQTAAAGLGKRAGEAVTRGVPRALGADLSSRVGMENLLLFGQPRSQKSSDIKSWLFDTVAGAPLGMPLNWVQGMQALVKGDMREAADKLVPVKAFRDIERAGFGLAQGSKDRNGRQLYEPYSIPEAAVQAMGFTPSSKAEQREYREAVRGDSKQLQDQRSKLTNAWLNGDSSGKSKAWSQIQKWNSGKPKDAQITMKDLTSAQKRRETEDEEGSYKLGVRVNKRNRHLVEENAAAYNTR